MLLNQNAIGYDFFVFNASGSESYPKLFLKLDAKIDSLPAYTVVKVETIQMKIYKMKAYA